MDSNWYFLIQERPFTIYFSGGVPTFSRCHSRYMAKVRVGEDTTLLKGDRLGKKDSSWRDILPKISLGEQGKHTVKST